MSNFTTRETFLIPSLDLEAKEREKLDKFLLLLNDSGVSEFIKDDQISDKGGRPSYSRYNIFATILYGFAFNSQTLRKLESSCRFDLRFIYLMEQQTPSHIRFGEFINEVIVPNRKEIFNMITKQIIKETGIEIADIFVDGSKFEADANKYKFVWKPTKNHEKLSDKIRVLLNRLDMMNSVPSRGIIDSRITASKLSELSRKTESNVSLKKDFDLLSSYLVKSLEYEEKERICGPDRNSYYKTDNDATAMCLKEDYYSGLGSNMHAGYNVQLAVSKGIICTYYVSQSRNDLKDFIPVLDLFRESFGFYPERVCADSGYGSLDNYEYLNRHNIGNYVKYHSFSGNVSGRNPDPYYLEEDGTLICLNGIKGYRTEISGRHPTRAGAVFYRIDGCSDCPFSSYCKRYMNIKDENHKILEVVERLVYYKQESLDNLLSVKGIEMRVNRSSQVEGAFGVIKEDMNYKRLRRTSMEKAETEFMLTFLGYNIRKLFRYFEGKARFSYWTAPDNLQTEQKRKPSARRLSNRVNKKKTKSVNEKAKSGYIYK